MNRLNWFDIIQYIKNGNPRPPRFVLKTEEEWRLELSEAQFQVTRAKSTEKPFSGEHCYSFEPALYACVCCGNWLFDSRDKFESGTGWPSFTQPVTDEAIKYLRDDTAGMHRVETQCNVCSAHLGHVFPDGPMPAGLRFCMNSIALKKVRTVPEQIKVATFGGGCFWCTEAVFQLVKGVKNVVSGYSGGSLPAPSYHQMNSDGSGYAEVVQIAYDETVVSYGELVYIHLSTHNPTTLNRQGADKGSRYRSVIFYHDEAQKSMAERVMAELQPGFESPIVTELAPFRAFYEAERGHQDYYRSNPDKPYCQTVIRPKLESFRQHFADMTTAS